jgi:hypothetical protein
MRGPSSLVSLVAHKTCWDKRCACIRASETESCRAMEATPEECEAWASCNPRPKSEAEIVEVIHCLGGV